MLNQQQVQTKDAVIETAADRFERRLTEEAARLDNRITEADAGLRVEIAETRTDLSTKIEKSKTETIRWMFIFYIGQVAALGGILFAVLR